MCSRRIILFVALLSVFLVLGAATSIRSQSDDEIVIDNGDFLPADVNIFLPLAASSTEIEQGVGEDIQIQAADVPFECTRNIVQNGSFIKTTQPWRCHNCKLIGFGGPVFVLIEATGRDSNGKYTYPSNVQLYQTGVTVDPTINRYEIWLSANSKYGEDVGIFVHKHTAPYSRYLELDPNKYDDPNTLPLEEDYFGVSVHPSDLRSNYLMPASKQTTPGDARVRIWFAPYLFNKEKPITYYAIDEICIQPHPIPKPTP